MNVTDLSPVDELRAEASLQMTDLLSQQHYRPEIKSSIYNFNKYEDWS